jgi:hypothetical protein
MFTSIDTHLPAAAETGLACVSFMTRGSWVQADAAALARRMTP